jgi:hypothetical protein
MFNLVIAFSLAAAAQTSSLSSSIAPSETPKFTYVLAEGFTGWACVDFGVRGAAPLKLRDDGSYQVDVQGGILPTSSFPTLRESPSGVEVLQLTDGRLRRVESLPGSERGETRSESPVSRHCLFFGTPEEAQTARRPPTLYESTMAGRAVTSESFEFVRGALSDFRDASRLCIDARGSDRDAIVRSAVAAGLALDSKSVRTKCSDSFAGIHIRFQVDRSHFTHSSARGAPFGFGELRRESPNGNLALVVWIDTHGGGARELARRFGQDLAEFLSKAAVAESQR